MTTPDEINRIRVELGLPPRGGTPTPSAPTPTPGAPTPDVINQMRADLGLPPREYGSPSVSPSPGGLPTITPAPPPGGASSPAPPGGGGLFQAAGQELKNIGGALAGLITDPAGSVQRMEQTAQRLGNDPVGTVAAGLQSTPEQEALMTATDLAGGGIRTPIRAALQVAPAVARPVNKLIDLIRAAEPIRGIQEQLRRDELRRRVGRAAGIMESYGGDEAFQRAKSALGGPMPNPQFAPPGLVEEILTPDDVLSLRNEIKTTGILKGKPLSRIRANDALSSVLVGEIPQRSEVVLLEEIFGPELSSAVLSKRPFKAKAWENTLDTLGIARTVQTAVDMSAPLRQGLLLATESPGVWAKSFYKMVGAYFDEGVSQAADQAIKTHPRHELYTQLGLYQAPLDQASVGIAAREEAFPSRFASKIPGVRKSERAYVTFLNKLRFDQTDNFYKELVSNGKSGPELERDLKKTIRAINWMTGRGPLGPSHMITRGPRAGYEIETGLLSDISPVLNASFFAPRLFTGVVMTPFAGGLNLAANKFVARALVKFVAAGMSITGLAAMRDDVNVEMDSRSSDFGKIQVGPHRFNVWGPHQPLARTVVQMATGQRKAVGSEAISSVSRWDVLGRFARSKFSPNAGLVSDVTTGESFMGEDITAPKERFGYKVHPLANMAYENFMFLFVQDVVDAIDEAGMRGGIMALPTFFGTGVQTFSTVDDVAQEAYKLPFTQLWPSEQREVRATHSAAQPVETPSQWDELEMEEEAALKEMDDMALGALRMGATRTGSYTSGTSIGSYDKRSRIWQSLAGGAYSTTGAGTTTSSRSRTPDQAASDVVDVFFAKRSELAAKREGLGVGMSDGSFMEPYEGPRQPTGGTAQERAALEEYHEIADEATSEEGRIFNTARYNAVLDAAETRWARDGTLMYVQASTHMEDIEGVHPNLWAMLPQKTKDRYEVSRKARVALAKRRQQEAR